jgi:hypothetical protein
MVDAFEKARQPKEQAAAAEALLKGLETFEGQPDQLQRILGLLAKAADVKQGAVDIVRKDAARVVDVAVDRIRANQGWIAAQATKVVGKLAKKQVDELLARYSKAGA